jgi:hypothetical protein
MDENGDGDGWFYQRRSSGDGLIIAGIETEQMFRLFVAVRVGLLHRLRQGNPGGVRGFGGFSVQVMSRIASKETQLDQSSDLADSGDQADQNKPAGVTEAMGVIIAHGNADPKGDGGDEEKDDHEYSKAFTVIAGTVARKLVSGAMEREADQKKLRPTRPSRRNSSYLSIIANIYTLVFARTGWQSIWGI